MTAENIYVRLADVEKALAGVSGASAAVTTVEQFTLVDGYERNEAGISELTDAEGNLVNHDGSREKQYR